MKIPRWIFACLVTFAIAVPAHAAIITIPTNRITTLKVLTSHNAVADTLVVYFPSTSTACAGKTEFSLDISGGKNQVAAAILHGAFLNQRGVRLEVDETQFNNRCRIVMVSQSDQ
jgi:hypothetical protein